MKKSLLIAVLPALWALGACNSEMEDRRRVAEIPEDLPDEESWNTTVVISDSAWVKAVIQAGHGRKFEESAETLVDSGIYVRFLSQNGSLNATLRADSATIDDKTGNMCAYGRVHVHSVRARTRIDTRSLCYDSETEQLKGDAWVSIVDSVRGREIEGVGFESDMTLENYTIWQPRGRAGGN